MLAKVFDLISFIGAIQGVMLACFLFSRRHKPAAVRFLAWYILIFSIGLLEPFAVRTLSGAFRVPLLSFLGASNFLYGPLLFLFVLHFAVDKPNAVRTPAKHFIPFVVVFVAEASLTWLQVDPTRHDLFLLLAFEALVIQILAYNFTAIRILKRSELSDVPSASQTPWLRLWIVLITAIYLISFLISHLIIFGVESAENFYLVVQLSITLTIYAMSYRLILDPSMFFSFGGRESPGSTSLKYMRSGLKAERAQEYVEQLTDFMLREKPYLDPDLNIYVLSQKLNISRNHLTQIINENLNKNFYELVNGYRVEEAKKMISDPRFSHMNLTGIGLEAGFKSKTAFNINFKKVAGCTPSEWKKSRELGPKLFDPGGR